MPASRISALGGAVANRRGNEPYNPTTPRPLVERLLGGSVRTAEERSRNRKGSKKDKEIMVFYFF